MPPKVAAYLAGLALVTQLAAPAWAGACPFPMIAGSGCPACVSTQEAPAPSCHGEQKTERAGCHSESPEPAAGCCEIAARDAAARVAELPALGAPTPSGHFELLVVSPQFAPALDAEPAFRFDVQTAPRGSDPPLSSTILRL